MGGLKSWPTSNQATSRTRNTCAKVRKSGRCGSMSYTLTAARGHQPSQHILLCRSPNIWWRYARRGKRYKPSAAFAACATSSASTAARAALRIFRFIEGASTYPKLCSCWNGLYPPLFYRVGIIVAAVLGNVTKPLSSSFRRLLTRAVRTLLGSSRTQVKDCKREDQQGGPS